MIRLTYRAYGEKGNTMTAYAISYSCKGNTYWSTLVEARDLKSAKKKLGKKHGYKDGRMVKIISVSVIGYF